MKATVSNQVIEVLNALCEKFGIAIDWTSQNVMPYVKEFINKAVNYELWTSVGWLLICAAFIFVFFKLIYWYVKNQNNESNIILDFLDYNEEFIVLFLIFGGILMIVATIGTVTQIMDIITCLTFPEKIIFNMIQSMM